jgi:hypothetical protein
LNICGGCTADIRAAKSCGRTGMSDLQSRWGWYNRADLGRVQA